MIIKEILTPLHELFDPKSAFAVEWDDQFGPKEMHASAYDRQGRTIDINFIPISENMIEIEFTRGGSHEITGKGDAPQVLTTVVEAIKTYLTKYYSAPYIVFSSASKEASRTGAYSAMISRMAAGLGYQPVVSDRLSPTTFMLKKAQVPDPEIDSI